MLNCIQCLIITIVRISYIYILSNKSNTTLYIGVTSNLIKRITEHKEGRGSVFTKKYKLTKLLYFEEFTDIRYAIAREKQLKGWKREWKLDLIKSINPNFRDLVFDLLGVDS